MVTTPNYGYTVPVVGGDFETWGGYLDANWTKIDLDLKAANDAIDAAEALIATVDANANNRVLRAGDGMTGPLILPATEPTNDQHATKKKYIDNGELAGASRYLFSGSLADADPGAGKIGFNFANARLATAIYVSTTTANGRVTPALINFIDGVVIGIARADRTLFYRITSVVDHGTWYTITVVSLTTMAGTAPAADTPCVLNFLGYLKPEVAPAPLYTDYLFTTWSYNSGKTQAHGLGHVPSDVRVLFKCMTPNNGYVADDIIYSSVASANSQAGHTVSADATNVYLGIGDQIFYQPRTLGQVTNLVLGTTAWDLILRVWS